MSDIRLTSDFPIAEIPQDPKKKTGDSQPTGKSFGYYWERILHMGLGEIAIKVARVCCCLFCWCS
jgi:hypothetical protein